jgi:hypothetical protein
VPASSSAWGALLAVHAQAQAGAVEEAALRIQPGGAHGVVQRIDLVAQHQRLPGAGRPLMPAALSSCCTATPRVPWRALQLLQVFGELAHQVAARNPHRQRHLLHGRGPGNGQRDAKQVGMQVGGLDAVVNARRQAEDFLAAMRRLYAS